MPSRPRRLHLHLVEVPLKTPFRHAAHARHSSLNVVVGLETADGIQGWGECLPREYVTGETAEGVHRIIRSAAGSVAWPRCESVESFIHGLESVADSLLPDHPSARCALDLALIDLGARILEISAMEIVRLLAERLGLPLRDASRPVIVSGVIGEGDLWPITKRAMKMRLFGLRQIKVKVGTDLEGDIARLKRLRRVFGRRTDLRVDANGAWSFEEAVAAVGALSTFRISSVEQPLARGDEPHLPRLRQAVDVPIALDESLTSLADARRAIRERECDLFNIRLSKCGGVVTSLRIFEEARRAKRGAWLGCMVGESPLLSSAGRAFALTVDGLCHFEGSYDRHLLGEFLFEPAMGFGWGGRAKPHGGHGWGVRLNRELLDKWSQRSDHIDL
ncbi:dipeptide epimerase [Candidatus Sumerlaeota bacterium]|nr:dipeptide epimerase [Candidatus Sumerlaeota bacterium]